MWIISLSTYVTQLRHAPQQQAPLLHIPSEQSSPVEELTTLVPSPESFAMH